MTHRPARTSRRRPEPGAPPRAASVAPSPAATAARRLAWSAVAALALAAQPAAAGGVHHFVGTAPGHPLPRPAGLAADARPAAVARAFLDEHSGLLRAGTAAVTQTVPAPYGAAVRMQQSIAGVGVLGGELTINVDRRGRVLSVLGETEPAAAIDTRPTITAPQAQARATASVARDEAVAGDTLSAGDPELAILDPRLLGGPGLRTPRLVWNTEVTSRAGAPLRRLVLVDAQLGVVAASIDQIETARDRRICDADSSDRRYPCAPPFQRAEGGAATGIRDIDLAYEYSGDTYDFYLDRFGRDSLDGAGLPLHSTVRWCPPFFGSFICPYDNAFWDGSQMVYGAGFAAADDVVGHELSHGVTDFSSHLFYYYQSGAINESLSDVFGELIDLSNGSPNDTPAVRWLIGEELGTFRNMKDPTAFGDPDRMRSPNYARFEGDAGGVHANSGVNNKAAYLMTDGGTFNGQTVTGLGVDKVAQIYYLAATTMLTSASDYEDLRNALNQACTNLVGTAGITAADCGEVDKVTLATEMNLQPDIAAAPAAPTCGGGETPVSFFSDDFENPASGNWAHSSLAGDDRWFYPQNDNPYGIDVEYATSGRTNLWGYAGPTTSDAAIALTHDIAVPPGATYLRFNHAYGFEDNPQEGSRFDGGVLEYSTDGGATWLDAGALGMVNGYNGTISGQFGNPLVDRKAFTSESHGYGATRVDLSSLAGQGVRFRFRIGTDASLDDYGWFIDDVRAYRCAKQPGNVTLGGATPESPANDNAPRVHGTAPAGTTVSAFTNATCAGDAVATGSPDEFAATGIAVPVPDDAATPITVQASDGPLTSSCSPPITYEEDSAPPGAPTLTALNPVSGSDDRQPRVLGQAEPATTVQLYADPGCTGTPVATGPAATLADPGFAVTVADESITLFAATATDRAGNRSACSEPLGYAERTRCAGRTPTITGTPGADVLTGTKGRDVIAGGDGNDTLRGLNGRDILCGGEGDDVLEGGRGSDKLFALRGHDTLRGGPGRDFTYR